MTILADEPPLPTEPVSTQLEGKSEADRESLIEMICRLHGQALYRFLLRVTLGDHREAEDLFQETLVRAWQYLEDHSMEVTRLRPWLYTVARRLSIDAARARQARPTEVTVTDMGAVPAPRDDIEQMLVRLMVQRGLMSLTDDHRQVLIQVFYHDLRARSRRETEHPRGHGQVPDALRAPRPRRRHGHHSRCGMGRAAPAVNLASGKQRPGVRPLAGP
jgi:RNA polymerase sigma-70 factor (ECF subfamily)